MIKAIIILGILIVVLVAILIGLIIYIREARKTLKQAKEALLTAKYSLDECIKQLSNNIDTHIERASEIIKQTLNESKNQYNKVSDSIEEKLTNNGFTKKE